MGVDPSMSTVKTDWRVLDKDDALSVTGDYKKKYRDSNPVVTPDTFHSGENYIERANKQFAYESERPQTFLNRPLTRA